MRQRVHLTSLFLAACVAAQPMPSRPDLVARLVGCYQIVLGLWLPPGNALDLPTTLRLERGGRVRPNLAAFRRVADLPQPRWRQLGGDSLVIWWSDRFQGLTLRLHDWGDSLSGRVAEHHDAIGGSIPGAAVTAYRAACPPDSAQLR